MGIGGSIVILMASMIANIPPQQIMTSHPTLACWLGFYSSYWLSWCDLSTFLLLSRRRAYRIPVNKIDIHNRFKQYSYLDIMLTS